MARYINSNILFQAYVHIDAPFEKIQENDSIKEDLDEFISDRARHFLYPEVDVDLEFKEGSIKTYATVRGTLRKCLRDNYEDFVSEIEHLYWFAKRLSDASNMEVAFLTGAFLGSIERTEARPGIIGQTKRIIDGILSIVNIDNDKKASATVRRFRVTKIDFESLLKNLVDDEDKVLVKKEIALLLKTLPKKLSKENRVAEKIEIEYNDVFNNFNKLLN